MRNRIIELNYRLLLQIFLFLSLIMSSTTIEPFKVHGNGNKPSPRTGSNMVYDPNNQEIILFGGLEDPMHHDWESLLRNDTWIYNIKTNSWKLLLLDVQPDERYSHSMVYNPMSNSVLLFGGVTAYGRVNDLWEFSLESKTWTNLEESSTPPVRSSSPLVYDANNNRIILFGGYGAFDILLSDTWTYHLENKTWTQIISLTKPAKRYGHSMVYDSDNEYMILFGGNDYGKKDDTWVLDCENDIWVELNSTIKPSNRYWHSMIYDQQNKNSIIFGGRTGSVISLEGIDDTWKYDHSQDTWEEIETSSSPPARYEAPFVYDENNQKAFLFGGYNGENTLNDLWMLKLKDGNYQWSDPKDTTHTTVPISILFVLSPLLLIVLVDKLKLSNTSKNAL